MGNFEKRQLIKKGKNIKMRHRKLSDKNENRCMEGETYLQRGRN